MFSSDLLLEFTIYIGSDVLLQKVNRYRFIQNVVLFTIYLSTLYLQLLFLMITILFIYK